MKALTFNVTPWIWLRARALAGLAGANVFWGRPGGLRLREVEPPSLPGDGWVLCRTRLGGICGSDLAMVRLAQPPDSLLQAFTSMPLIGGHENVAQVVRTHSPADQAWIGRRVCVEPTLACAARGIEPPCRRCAAGEFGACESFGAAGQGRFSLPAGTSIGYNRVTGGAWGEYFAAHVSQLVEAPDALSDEQAILTDPLACSAHAVLRAELADVQAVAVLGGGILGLGVAAALRAVGFTGRVDLFARHAFQRELAGRLGATEAFPERQAGDVDDVAARVGGSVLPVRFGRKALVGGYDVTFDAVGSPATLNAALQLTRGRGQAVLLGTSAAMTLDTMPLWFRELTILGAYGRQSECWQGGRISTYALVHQWLTEGRLTTDGLLTHTFALADYRAAFRTAAAKADTGCVRAAFDFR
ncbi:MAG: alcohol dehydrogenase catalytic domain-containing protein [Planctomycetes bacterium]|nr:alcohol dehydrogenase catalytic domain-containing protein [Planctomycetota bacterium]